MNPSAFTNHRFILRRSWISSPERIVNFIMLNPSTADDRLDDPTIRRCVGFAKAWGFSHLVVTNLFAFRATHARDLEKCVTSNAILAIGGQENDLAICTQVDRSDLIVCAWGDSSRLLPSRVVEVTSMLVDRDLHCIRQTAKGNPAHPVRERYTSAPILWKEAKKVA